MMGCYIHLMQILIEEGHLFHHLLGRCYLIVNVNFNRDKPLNGGSNAIYGVDGSVTARDIYFKKPGTTGKGWYCHPMIPYGRGGAGFSVLDITNPISQSVYILYLMIMF